eukprot:4743778-Pyramimonas_sp.AAC.1
MVHRRIGMAELPEQEFCIEKARVGIVHISAICPGGVLWVNVYLHDSQGVSHVNWPLLTRIGGILYRYGLPFV